MLEEGRLVFSLLLSLLWFEAQFLIHHFKLGFPSLQLFLQFVSTRQGRVSVLRFNGYCPCSSRDEMHLSNEQVRESKNSFIQH